MKENLGVWALRNIGARKLFYAVLFILYLNVAGYFRFPQPRLRLDHVYVWFIGKCQP